MSVTYSYLGYTYKNGCVYDCHGNPLSQFPDWFQEILLERHPYIGEFEYAIQEMVETNNWRK